ncbi:MAG TPA: metal-dependent phosphohydrolase [Thermoanaerobaculia bacterium]|jgi:predicted metal-dependent HD superfamily phosphohydrolase|nr:metal-dependent phosphohydrolase [Thermoanaerobaculia bacterium]
MNAHERFISLGPRDVAERWLRDLEARYSEPHRHYHTLAHIEHMLELLPHADETVVAAVWFHDAIYVGNANEERSAVLAREALQELGFAEEKIALVERMILATKKHEPADLPEPGLAFLDADLAILGSERTRYDEYVLQIREEYAHVPDDAFRIGRDAILRRFLARPRLYFTDGFYARFEEKARENIEREIADR